MTAQEKRDLILKFGDKELTQKEVQLCLTVFFESETLGFEKQERIGRLLSKLHESFKDAEETFGELDIEIPEGVK